MSVSNLYSQFDIAYKNAKLLVKQNEALDARSYLITCMTLMLEIYKNTDGVMERAKLYAHICEFKKISAILFERGITSEVKTWFGIVEKGKNQELGENQLSQNGLAIGDSIDWAAEIFAKCSNSVATVSARTGTSGSNGTGFVISSNGYLLTNDHVIFDESIGNYYKNIKMTLYGKKDAVPIEIVHSDKKNDVALCKFEIAKTGEVTPVKRINDYSKLLPGASVLVIGNGLSMGLAPFIGNVKFTHDDEGNLVSTVPSNHGDSGGPVFNRKGECVGINKSVTVSVTRGVTTMEAQGITNATPMDKIDELLAKWCKQYGIEL